MIISHNISSNKDGPLFSRHFLGQLKELNPIEEIIGEDTELRSAGKELAGWHKKHDSKSKASLKVNPIKGVYTCWNCSESGDVFTWLELNRGMTFVEACRYLADRAGISFPDVDPEKEKVYQEYRYERSKIEKVYMAAARFFNSNLKDEHVAFCRKKWGFKKETLDEHLIGFAPPGNELLRCLRGKFEFDLLKRTGLFVKYKGSFKDLFQGRVVFPYWHDGRVVYFNGRATDETPEWEKKKDMKYLKLVTHSDRHSYVSEAVENRFLLGEDSVRVNQPLIITEGVCDYLAVRQAGYPCLSPATNQFSSKDIDRMCSISGRASIVYIVNDADDAGRKGAFKTAEKLECEGVDVRLVDLPEGDAADFLRDNGVDAFELLLDRAKTLLDIHLEQLKNESEDKELTAPAVEEISKALIQQVASIDSPVARDGALNRVYKIMNNRYGTTKGAIREAIKKSRNEGDKKTRLRAAEEGEIPELQSVKKVLPDAPVSDGLRVPGGWALSMRGVEKIIYDGDGKPVDTKRITPSPVIITGRLLNNESSTEFMHLSWWRDGCWMSSVVDREQVASSRDIVKLAAIGFPVDSGTASDVVRFLSTFEAENITELPKVSTAETLGWGKNQSVFLCGQLMVTKDSIKETLSAAMNTDPKDWGENWVVFHAPDSGEEQIAKGYYSQGSFDNWKGIVEKVEEYPRVLLAVPASLAPVLLQILNAHNFILDWSYPTSSGKTTVLRLAGSSWGQPNETELYKVVHPWDATRVGVERLCSLGSGLPVILDDTKKAKDKEAIAQVVYDVASGSTRVRGSVKGMQKARAFRTVLLSSGESRITSFTKDGGMHARVLSVWGPPFKGRNKASLVSEINRELMLNFGHAGPRFVQFVLENRDQWLVWKKTHRKIEREYMDMADGDPILSRYSDYYATLSLTAHLACEALDFNWSYDPIEALWEDLAGGIEGADNAKAAFMDVIDFIYSRPDNFYDNTGESDKWSYQKKKGKNQKQPFSGWLGRWDREGEWGYIYIFPERIKEFLDKSGYEVDEVLSGWRENGWLKTNGSRYVCTKHFPPTGTTTSFYAIKREAIEEVTPDEDDPSNSDV